MHTIVENLIKQHYGNREAVDPETMALLQDLEKTLGSQDSLGSLRSILDNMPFGITLIDKKKHIQHANQSALDLMGYSSLDEVTGHLCHDTLCPAAADRCPILDLNQSVDRSDRVLITKDGQQVPILKSVTPIILDGEEVLLEAFIDISEHKRSRKFGPLPLKSAA